MERAGRSGSGWTGRLLIGLALILVGAAAATWALARYQPAARVLGVVPATQASQQPAPVEAPAVQPQVQAQPQALVASDPALAGQVAQLQSRLERVESASNEAQGSAGRADALLIAFAARRAIDRGTPLGYLEPLLVRRFGPDHPQAVAMIVTASRTPVRLPDLIQQYQDLEQQLLGPPPNEGLWTGVKRGFGSLISVRRADRPSSQPQARYERARSRLMAGEVDSALAETMRLPGAARARDWTRSARQYVAVHRALDQIESAALMSEQAPR